jgi:hypothetical protein
MPVVKASVTLEDVGKAFFSKQFSLVEDESVLLEYEVATATTAQDIPISFTTGIAAVDVMLITSTYAITYFLNGSATAITLDANGVHLLCGTNITAMTVTNASGSTAVIKIYLAGT